MENKIEIEDRCYNIMCPKNTLTAKHHCSLENLIDFCPAVRLEPNNINRMMECENAITHLKNMLAAGERTIQVGSEFDLLVERIG